MTAEWIEKNRVTQIRERFPSAIGGEESFRGETTLLVHPPNLVELCRYLFEDPDLRFDSLSDVYAIDRPEKEKRFSVVYLLKSIPHHHRLRLRSDIPEKPGEIDSVYPVWRAAGFLEREVYDLMGVKFKNHPDLRRIFMPDDYEGHPLRKDYPVEGKGWRNTIDFLPTEEAPPAGGK